MPTIFIEIAAYRDSELPKTLASCLKNAAYPDDLRFAIVNQAGPETEHLLDEYLGDPRFQIVTYDWRTARGVGQARRQTNELYKGEDFYLQIDSHMRFLPNWDERLLAEWHKTGDDKAIISSYPPAYKYDDNDQEIFISSKPNRLVVHEFYLGDIPIFFGKEIKGFHDSPVVSAFASGGLQFGPGRARVCRCAVRARYLFYR